MITKETVEKVSKLARLQLTPEEHDQYSRVMSAVLENFEQIAKVDTTGVKPLVTPTDMQPNLRTDVVDNAVESEKLLANAPEKSGRLFRVPPVV